VYDASKPTLHSLLIPTLNPSPKGIQTVTGEYFLIPPIKPWPSVDKGLKLCHLEEPTTCPWGEK
jgi:hypothetical protein